MSEIKRAPLIPLGSQKEFEKSSKELRKTIRISVVLPESTEDTCPEYNYKDELATTKKKSKCKEGAVLPNGLSRLEDFDDDDDDDVRRIAREMEEKYGTGTSLNKKKRKIRKDDYADIGMGYDESDSFIDNTDGYDEMIPQNVTTLHGGFYINSGALEFKTDDEANSDFSSSSSEDEDDSTKNKTSSRKRIIESSDETDRENKTESVSNANHLEKKRKLQNGGNGMQPSLKKKLMAQNKIYIKKRRLLDPQKKTVKELLREKREDLNMSIPSDLKTDSAEDDDKESKKYKNRSNVSDVIESVVKASSEKNKSIENNNITKIIVNSSSDGESSHDNSLTKPDVKLPENLPADILNVITSVKNTAEKNSDGFIFTSEINSLILRLERKCKCLGKPSKLKVYEHLSTFLKCNPDNLIKKAKSLVLDDEQKKLKNLQAGLQMEINKVMPSLLESHEKETQRILQKKFSQDSVDEENKNLRMPKRRFQWNDATKKFVKDILMMKKRCLLLEGKSKDALDTQMLTFLKSEIQTLWPDGWMSMNALNKIYTTYADPKRILNNGNQQSNNTQNKTQSTITTLIPTATTTQVKNLPQSFNNTNLSITPIVSPSIKSETNGPSKVVSVNNEVTVTACNDNSLNLSKKPLPADSSDIIPTSPKKETETTAVKLKVKSPSELLKPTVTKKEPPVSLINDDVIILDGSSTKNDRICPTTKDKYHAKSDDNYCQVIDLSDKNDFKLKSDVKSHPKKDVKPSSIAEQINKHHELSITPSYPTKVESATKAKASCAAGDDIQKVMENLKVLQKMSSPKKCVESSPTSSAVSVIAVNKSFAPKSSAVIHSESSPTMQRFDYNKSNNTNTSEYNTSFQDEFQKQLFSALNHYSTPNTNKSYNSIDRYPHIATSGPSKVTNDKYYQNSNNNYSQSSNGHKSSASTPQTGTYSILDDMFANLLTQYGYAKEATAPKSQQK